MSTLRTTITALATWAVMGVAVAAPGQSAGTSPTGTDAGTGTGTAAQIEGALERGAKAAANGIERGAKAAAHGIKVGVSAAARGVARGAEATARAADTVARKVQPSSPAPMAAPKSGT